MVLTDRAVPGPAPARVPAARSRPGPARVALLLGTVGVAYRLAMLLAEVPPTNSDEATTGLVALHVAEGRAFPLFFYGQWYMGALESYLAAPLFVVGLTGTAALRLPNLLLYAAFLALMWRLVGRLYTPWFATAVVGLLALGSDRILKNQLIAGGGYPEMSPAGALLVLLAVSLGLGSVRRPALAVAGWGLVAGLTLWDDWLVLPYVAASGALLLAGRWRDLCGRAGVALVLGLAAGLVPIVAHNLTAAPEHRSLAVYRQLAGEGLTGSPLVERLHGGVLFGLPMGTGFCAPGRCADWQLWWGIVAPLLLLAAGLLALRGLWRGRRAGRPALVRQGGRLALVVAAATSLAAYAGSEAAARTPVESARYLSCLLVSLPALLWPLWVAAAGRARSVRRPRAAALLGVAGRGGLAAVAAGMLAATAAALAHAPQAAAEADRRRELVAALDRLGVSRFHTEYWTCNTVVFATRERLLCGVLRDDLRAGWDRHPAYPAEVARADRPAYVLPAGTALSAAVADRLARSGVPVTRTVVAGYDVYQVSAPVDLPLR